MIAAEDLARERLRAWVRWRDEHHGVAPTVREFAEACGITLAPAHAVLNHMICSGWLGQAVEGTSARAQYLTDAGEEMVGLATVSTEYETLPEFAARHGVKPNSVHRAIRTGRLRAQRFGWAWAIPPDQTFERRKAGRQKHDRRVEQHSQLAERTVAIMQELLGWTYEGGPLPYGTLTAVGEQFGLSRERIRQIAGKIGLEASGEIIASPVYLACGSCGIRPVRGWRTGGVQCVECKKVPVACDYCGIILYRDETQVLHNARQQRGMGGSGAVQCSRAGKKRCPRGPVMFVLQLGREWQKVWISDRKYVAAAKAFASSHGFKVTSEKREDGYWMRRVG